MFAPKCSRANPRAWLGRASKSLDLAVDGEALKRLRLDLAHALPRQAEASPNLVEGFRIRVAVHSVAELQHVLLAFGQRAHRSMQCLFREPDVNLLFEIVLRCCDDVAEGRIALVAERLVEARDRTSALAQP